VTVETWSEVWPEDFITTDDLAWWLDLAPTLSWRWATTYADSAPHSYVVRDKDLDSTLFDRAARVIRTYGRPGKFFRSTQLYLYDPPDSIPGSGRPIRKWWTMSGPVSIQGVINTTDDDRVYGKQDAPDTRYRPPRPPTTVIEDDTREVYDALATAYDARYDPAHCPQCTTENEAIARLIRRHFGAYAPSTLDVGCGTGLTLDLHVTAPGIYTGVDPSQGMLNQLVQKHPRATRLLPMRMETALSDQLFAPRSFELVVSLFGSPSYLEPWAISPIAELSSDLTVLMHYRRGYWPSYWPHKPAHIDESREAAVELVASLLTEGRRPARQFDLDDMVVTVIGG